jgi:Flp pilus assembly protein TadG
MMIRSNQARRVRRGVVLPLVAVCLIALIGLVALAIDIGMVAVAKTQAQNAADCATTAGVRSINGSTATNYNNFNGSTVAKTAVNAATQNYIYGAKVPGDPNNLTANANGYSFSSGDVVVDMGAFVYQYDDTGKTTEQFVLQFPKTTTTEPYDAVRATINYAGNWTFGRVFGGNGFNVQAVAVAAHRPRDVMVIMDLSGSMKFQSLVGYPYYGARTQSMNPDTLFPQFGHYSSASAALQMPNPTTSVFDGTYTYAPNNITMDSANNGPAIVKYYYSNPATGTTAFSPSSATNTTPNGDIPLFSANNNAGGGNYAQTLAGSTASTCVFLTSDTASAQAYEHDGYQSTKFNTKPSTYYGYTEGPAYYGKTFFIWPPDPGPPLLATGDPTVAANHANNGAEDWRQRFFFKVKNNDSGALEWLDDNSVLFDSSGYIRAPGSGSTVSANAGGTNYNYFYRINYAAILNWLRNISPTHFPTSLLTGRIQFWSDIPNPTSATYTGMTGGLNQYFWTTADTSLTVNERFWRGYIDWVLGVQNTGLGGSGYLTYSTSDGSNRYSAYIGPGETFTWGTVGIHTVPWTASGTINNSGGYPSGTSATIKVSGFTTSNIAVGNYVKFGLDPNTYLVSAVAGSPTVTSITLSTTAPFTALANAVANGSQVRVYTSYMNYTDNPRRPRHHFWFGPMTFIDYTGNYNMGQHWWPGDISEAQSWACKAGIQTAIDDISKNHPNDYVGLTFFSTPMYSLSDFGTGHHNQAVVPLGRSYQNLKDSLWFPPTTVTGGVSSITPFDVDFNFVPRANGGTTPCMPFMIAYNMFSNSLTNLRTYAQPSTTYRGFAGGMGRNGASRLIIFETDGVPNTGATATLAGSGANSYYPIRVANPADLSSSKNVEWPSNPSFANSQVYSVVQQICAQTTASPPGFSTARKAVQVWCIGYGDIYDPSGPGATARGNGMTFLRTIMYNSGTAPDTTGSNFPDSLLVYGNTSQRVTRMQTAFTQIMQSGVQVSLLQ